MNQSEVLLNKVRNGFMMECVDDMKEEYPRALKQTLTIVGDTERSAAFNCF